MLRKDREITDLDRIQEIISRSEVCRLAFFDEGYPYILPMNFGFERVEDTFVLYFHTALRGKKLELLKANNHVSFEMDGAHKLYGQEDVACSYGMEFESVVGSGTAELVEGEEKIHGLSLLMKQYVKDKEFVINDKMAATVAIIKLSVHQITGKALKK